MRQSTGAGSTVGWANDTAAFTPTATPRRPSLSNEWGAEAAKTHGPAAGGSTTSGAGGGAGVRSVREALSSRSGTKEAPVAAVAVGLDLGQRVPWHTKERVTTPDMCRAAAADEDEEAAPPAGRAETSQAGGRRVKAVGAARVAGDSTVLAKCR